MDAAAQLALMMKARTVFEDDSTFLSFPVTPVPFAPGDLDLQPAASAEPDEVRRVLANQQEFATLVNLVPRGEVWLAGETTLVWDVYESVLRGAEVASSTRSADEEQRYAAAVAYLRSGDGDSGAVTAYRQYKDAYLLALQEYLAAKSTAQSSTDSATVSRWRTVDDPSLRAKLAGIAQDWVVKGHRNEVESARTLVATLGALSPLARWAEWRALFNRDLDAMTGVTTDASIFFPTSFAPSNALDDHAWKPFTLDVAEVRALLDSVPAKTRERLGGGGTTTMTSLSFEFSSATLVRPWFAPEALRARFWRLPAGGSALSNGEKPPTGRMTAYVTALVFARRVVLIEAGAATPSIGFQGFVFENGFEPSSVQRLVTKNPVGRLGRGARALQLEHKRGITASLRHHGFIRLPDLDFVTSPTTPPATPAAPDPTTVFVLAFICKPVGKSPDPDSGLQWA